MIMEFLARRRTANLLRCTPRELSLRSVYLPEFNLIYLINPKVASSTIINSLLMLNPSEYGEHVGHFYGREARQHISSERDPIRFYRDLISESTYIFSLVRHPFTRALSCYHDKICGPQKARFRSYLGLNLEGEVAFRDFLLAVAMQPPMEMNRHWRPQSWLLPKETRIVIKRFETLHQSLCEVAAEAQIARFEIHDFSPHATKHDGSHDEDHDLVREIYRCDFDHFGY